MNLRFPSSDPDLRAAERQAYIEGNIPLAAALGIALDKTGHQLAELRDEIEYLSAENSRLARKLAEYEGATLFGDLQE